MPGSAAVFFELSLFLQTAIGAGYLAYVTAYAGFRKDHSAADQISITLVFSSLALVFANSLTSLSDGWRVAATLASIILLGIVWRILGRPTWHWLLSAMKIHREDGVYSGWAALVQTTRGVSQATILTADGKKLHLADRDPYRNYDWGGLYLCGDGSVTMIVDSETDANGVEVSREDIADADWGARFTYIPASQIRRVELRMK